jgi:hypothetical protein
VKRSGREEPVGVAIHMCMEATFGISPCSYLYQKLPKILSFLLSLMFSLQQNQGRRGYKMFCPEGRGCGRREEVAQTMYTHVSKCKNYKTKEKKAEVS